MVVQKKEISSRLNPSMSVRTDGSRCIISLPRFGFNEIITPLTRREFQSTVAARRRHSAGARLRNFVLNPSSEKSMNICTATAANNHSFNRPFFGLRMPMNWHSSERFALRIRAPRSRMASKTSASIATMTTMTSFYRPALSYHHTWTGWN